MLVIKRVLQLQCTGQSESRSNASRMQERTLRATEHGLATLVDYLSGKRSIIFRRHTVHAWWLTVPDFACHWLLEYHVSFRYLRETCLSLEMPETYLRIHLERKRKRKSSNWLAFSYFTETMPFFSLHLFTVIRIFQSILRMQRWTGSVWLFSWEVMTTGARCGKAENLLQSVLCRFHFAMANAVRGGNGINYK